MSTKLLKGRAGELRAAHETLALATIVAIVVHGVSLLGDQFLHPTIFDISIPFVSGYKTLWTSLGIVGGWGLILLGLSYYARARIGVQRWRSLHRLTALAWILGLVHSLGEGTDSGKAWFVATTVVVALPALALLALRWLGRASTPAAAEPEQRLAARASVSRAPRPTAPALGETR